jgi:hypothetical protein
MNFNLTLFCTLFVSQATFLSGMDDKLDRFMNGALTVAPFIAAWGASSQRPKLHKPVRLPLPALFGKVRAPEDVDAAIKFTYPYLEDAIRSDAVFGLTQQVDGKRDDVVAEKVSEQLLFIGTHVATNMAFDHVADQVVQTPYAKTGQEYIFAASESLLSPYLSQIPDSVLKPVHKACKMSAWGAEKVARGYVPYVISSTLLHDEEGRNQVALGSMVGAAGEVAGYIGDRSGLPIVSFVTKELQNATRSYVGFSGLSALCSSGKRTVQDHALVVGAGTAAGLVVRGAANGLVRTQKFRSLADLMTGGWSQERKNLAAMCTLTGFRWATTYAFVLLMRYCLGTSKNDRL